jgi:hypothetical protein
MFIAFSIHSSVVTLALSSVSIMGAGLAPAMLIRVLRWRHTDLSLFITVVSGTLVGLAWIETGMNKYINEAAPGFAVALLMNFLISGLFGKLRKKGGLNDKESIRE